MTGIGDWAAAAAGGSLPLAIPVALLAGLVSFFSPCVLPLLPGYLSYATGLAAADVTAGRGPRGRLCLGTGLFVLGFAFVFVSGGALFGGLGGALLAWSRPLTAVAGVVAIALGFVFAGRLRIGQTTLRPSRAPGIGIAAAPVLGVAFGIGWTPCIGPTLAVVLTLALNEGTAVRGAVLALAYALGLGLPFLAAALAFDRLGGTFAWVRRHHETLQLVGGALLVAVGVLLVTGWWDGLMAGVRSWAGAFGVPI